MSLKLLATLRTATVAADDLRMNGKITVASTGKRP